MGGRGRGGAAGGSGTGVGGKLWLGATGTGTVGSIRQPAAFTGTVGLKPTYGRCSRWGIVAFASSLDQAGPITRDVRDAAIMLGSMAGHDEKDTTSVDRPVPDYEAVLSRGVTGLSVCIPIEHRPERMPSELADQGCRGIAWPRAAGAISKEVSRAHSKYALSS